MTPLASSAVPVTGVRADVSTVDLLTYLADRFDGTETLVLATYRPEDMRLSGHVFLQVRSTLEQRGRLTEIPLGFLRVEDIDRYVALEYPGHTFPPDLARALHARSEGSPLFVVAPLRDLERQDVIVREGGAWTLARSIEEVEGELLGVAAVQGYEFDAAVVADALGVDVGAVEESLATLARDHGLARRTEDAALPDGSPTAHYEFVHVLYQHGLLDAVGPATRVAWSRRVADALIDHGTGEDPSMAAELHEAGRNREGRDVLGPARDWFNEGFDTRDLGEARELLEVLGG